LTDGSTLEAYGDIKQRVAADQPPHHLMQPACEPWSQLARQEMTASQRNYTCYSELLRAHPKLFDQALLRVTDDDWKLAKLVTPGLNSEAFGVGKIWPLAWHQLRRTGAVNMQASGLVSDFSLQYQLKHSTLISSLYYGQGYSQLSLNQSAQSEYLRAMYEVMGRELTGLLSDSFVSPYGSERKRTILQIVSESEHKKLVAAAKAGQVAWRPTLLGGCTKRGPCEYGGIDNIVRCGGGDNKAPCADALFDQSRVPLIQRLSRMLLQQIEEAENDTPYKYSLEAQRRAAENALDVLSYK
jgi:hypothetical protein